MLSDPQSPDCLIWQGTTNGNGYGKKGTKYVHRVAWEEVNGPIPAGYEIHHVCGIRLCYNAEHLSCLPRDDHLKLHACQEHDEWVVSSDGRRRCKACRRERNRLYKAKQRAENPEKYLADMRAWREKNREKYTIYQREYRAARAGKGVD